LKKHETQDGGQGMLAAAAIGSTNLQTAQALLANKASSASLGAHIWAMRAAEVIETSADLRRRAEAALQ
jgi:hypothetical protein